MSKTIVIINSESMMHVGQKAIRCMEEQHPGSIVWIRSQRDLENALANIDGMSTIDSNESKEISVEGYQVRYQLVTTLQ